MSDKAYFWLALLLALSLSASVSAQLHTDEHAQAHQRDAALQWEGSPDGIAYSEFNHHLAAVFVLLMGLSELVAAFALRSLAWIRFLLPAAMLAAGGYLLGWSDHDAWPIGSLSFAQTFIADDLEIQQHKLYALLFLSVGTVEALRWLGKISGPAGAWPLSVLAIVGGLLLFAHEHGDHPAAHSIAMNHMIMGTIAIAAGFGIRWLIQLTVSRSMPLKAVYWASAMAVLLTSATALAANWPFNNRRHYFIANDYVENLLSTIEPNGLLLTQDWQVVSPMFYAQEEERRRPDVKVVDINLLRRSWYFDYLRHAYPSLIERSREKIDTYLEDLKEWEHDPGAFARSQPLTQKISVAFSEMVRSIVTNEIRFAPVYITNELLAANQTNSYLTQWIPQTYQLVPQGLIFNLATDQSFHDSPDPHLQTRGLADGTARFEKDDVVNLKVLPTYTSMLVNRGRYFALFNQHERAIIAFKEALTLDPNLVAAREGLAQSTAKLPSP